METVAVQAAGQAVGSLVTPAVEGGKGIFSYLKRKYGYVKNIKEHMGKLEKEKSYLFAEDADVKTKLERNKLLKEKTKRCEIWLNEVEKMKQELEPLKVEYENTSRYFCGLCPFPRLLKLGKRIVKKTADVEELKNQIAHITIMDDKPAPPPPPVIEKHPQKINDMPSLNSRVAKLLEWLEDEELKRIRIWGPPGVGKTTIMANSHDRVGASRKFDFIFWVDVTVEGGIRGIGDVIWKRLDMKGDGNYSDDQRANMMSQVLKDKSYVLFLDHIFSEINLREVGIHYEHEHGKVVFACRYKNDNICGDTDEEMNVPGLSEEDAGNFFWKVVGSHPKSNQEIKPVAKLIINECGGMPNMIKLIGNKLANELDPAIWRDTLWQLRSPTMGQQQELEEVYKAFKLVYEKLPEHMKLCLLYWAVFPAGYEIFRDHIIDCWRAEQFFSSLRIRKFQATRDRGHKILDELVKKSLLEKGRKWGHFKMFEYFQRVALRIANLEEDFNIFVMEDENIIEEEWENARRVTLIGGHLYTLPRRPRCCGLLTLLLQQSSLTEFPKEFFDYMRGLQVLNLHETRITALPLSISSLTNLKGLFLNNCGQLGQIPSQIGDLLTLEILDIRQTGIDSLPIEIGQLANLKCLRVSFSEDVGNHNNVQEIKPLIPSNVIAKLSKLEELSIGVTHNGSRYQNAAEIAHEISELEELTTLCFFFPEMESFKSFIQNSKSWRRSNTFTSFRIVVGCQRNGSTSEFSVLECSTEKHLKFSAGNEFPDAISQVLRQAKAFELIGHQTAPNLSIFRADYLQGLEACIIEECNEMESIIDRNRAIVVSKDSGTEFECLKWLHINNLPKLTNIWRGSIESKSLFSLTTLTIKGCHSIGMLLSQGMIIRLSQLQNLQVEDCRNMKEIMEDGTITESHVFPKLKNLQLRDLPGLYSISHFSLQWPSLETILIKTCMQIRNFPAVMKNATKLRIIQCAEDWWNQQDWPNGTLRDDFKRFASFI